MPVRLAEKDKGPWGIFTDKVQLRFYDLPNTKELFNKRAETSIPVKEPGPLSATL